MNKIIKLSCIYEYNGEVNDITTWDGIVEVKRSGYCFHNIEGFSIDKMDIQDKKVIHKRYILGINGLDKSLGNLFFTVFAGNLYPISYRLKFDEEDNCYYGTWHFLREEVLFDETKRRGCGSGFAKIEIHDENNYTQSDLIMDKKSRLPYFNKQYGDVISRRLDEGTPTGEINGIDNESFGKAKDFFKQNKNAQQLVKHL